MFCPSCRYEYNPGVDRCVDCDVPLVVELPPEPDVEYVELVTVFASGDPARLAVAKSVLESAGIPFYAKGEAVQNLFALGSVGGFNPLVGPVQLQVEPDRADEARALLEQPDPDRG